MATSRLACASLLLLAAAAHGREAASPSACQAAGQRPEIVSAKSAVARAPDNVRANFALADAWSEAGCFGEAVQVLQAADKLNPGDTQLQTRLRVARSLVVEEHFFDNIDSAEAAARLKRNTFRCTSLADLDACNEASRLAPSDPTVMTGHADALMHANRPAEAVVLYRHASALAPKQADLPGKITAAERLLPAAPPPAVASALSGNRTPSAPATRPAVKAPRPPSMTASSKTASSSQAVRLATVEHAEPVSPRFSNDSPDETQSH